MCIRDRNEDALLGWADYQRGQVAVIFSTLFAAPIRFSKTCLLYTSDAADERSSVDLGGSRIIKQKNNKKKTKRTQKESSANLLLDTHR